MILFWILFSVVLLFGFVTFRGAPYVPSQKRYIREAFSSLYKVSARDTLVDIGSGDGVVLRLAAERGAQAIGYELNPALIGLSWILKRGNKKIHVRLADFWLTSLPSETTIVYIFIVSRDARKMTRKLQKDADQLNKSFYVLSYGAKLADQPVEKSLGAYFLYQFHPLQPSKAQV